MADVILNLIKPIGTPRSCSYSSMCVKMELKVLQCLEDDQEKLESSRG